MSRAYLRLDPGFYDRKVIDQKYPPAAATALIGALCHAEHQPIRGRFRDARVLRSLLGPLARWIPYLIEHHDLLDIKGQLYVDGWDEWQEGDWKVGERVKRIRNRTKVARALTSETVAVTPEVTPGVTVPVTVENESGDSVGTVYNLSDGGRQSVIDGGGGRRSEIPPPPAERGRRKDETNPRAAGSAPRQTGDNPRANGTSPRQERQAAKRAPTRLGDILGEAARRQAESVGDDVDVDEDETPAWLRSEATT